MTLSAQLTAQLKQLSQREGVTLFMTLLTAFQVLLLRYSGQSDIVVGSPIANRTHQHLEGLIGFFVNTLVLRTDLSGNPTFVEALQRVREVTLGAYAHQDLPFERLVEDLQPERSLSHNPLCQVLFQLLNAPRDPLALTNLKIQRMGGESQTTKADLVVTLVENDRGLQGQWEYSSDLFEQASIVRMAAHFITLSQSAAADPTQCLSDLSIMSDTDMQEIEDWSDYRDF